jgi:CubicO group peptidase (beta-lactamase class C family)
MQDGTMRLLLMMLLGFWAPISAWSQTSTTQVADAPKQVLSEFEGHYEYRDGLTLFMVTRGEQLFAVIGQSKYLLRVSGTDTFLNPPGDSIPFVRDEKGRITAFKEYGQAFARLSSNVPASARSLLEPRAVGADGTPAAYRYEAPPHLPDGIRVGKAGLTTLPPNVAEQLVNGVIDGTYADVNSLLIYHDGALLLEEYFYGYDRDRMHEMRSFTKSVISLLAGAAVDRGLLSANEPVLTKLPYPSFGNPDSRKAKVTLTHLLSNQSGFACNEYDRNSPGNEVNLYETKDWVKAFVDLPMVSEPGTTAHYCSGGFYTAGNIIERAAGKPLPDFADEVLFKPLGIGRSAWQWNFALDLSQRNEFGQIYLRPRDMLKLGILIHDRGKWMDRRILSTSWIEAAIAHQARVDDSDYGLGIWHRWYNVQGNAGNRRVDTIMLSGNGGQKVFIVPEFDLLVVSTGTAFFVDSPLNRMMAQVLLPALINNRQNQHPSTSMRKPGR